MSDQDHAKLAPSSAERTEACTGSRKLAAMFPEQEETIESREGTAAHWAASELLHDRPVAVGQIAPNDVRLNDEMIEGAELYADHIKARGNVGSIEQMVRNDALHPTDNYGTPDHYVFEPMHLYVDDFKFGHDFIEIFKNWQLINYVALLLKAFGIDGVTDQLLQVTMTIIQPRSYHRDGPIRTWTLKASELRPYFNRLQNRFEEAMTDNAPCTVNPHCEYCPGRHACEALTASSFSGIRRSYSSVPLILTPAAMGLELRMIRRAIDALKARESGISEQVFSTIRSGINVPYFGIEFGQGRQAWNKPVDEVILLGEMLNVNLRKSDAITPKQAIAKGIPAELVAAYSWTPSGAAKLTEDNGNGAAKIFT